jgi:hypothetical protein
MNRLLACLFGVLLPLCAFQVNPAAEKPKEEKKGSIEGRVVNGVTGEALKKVTLMLAGSGSSARPATADTDDSGNFAFKELDAGKYQLLAERTGFARQAYGARRSALSGTTLSLSAGQTIKDLLFKLAPNAVISGRVLDEDGEPVPNVTILTLQPAYQRGKRQFLPTATAQSNDLGEFRVAGLAAGRYMLSATYRNLAAIAVGGTSQPSGDKPEMAYVTTYYPNSADVAGAVPVIVDTGTDLRGTDIRMLKTKTIRVKGKLGGVLQGKTAMVLLTPKGVGFTGLMTGNISVARPPDGAFEIRGVAPGSYVLSALAADNMTALVGGISVEVGDQHIDGVLLSPGEGGELLGVVTVEGTAPADLKKTQVGLESLGAVSLVPPRGSVDDDGKFTVKNVAPDRYLVQLTGAPETAFVRSVRLGNQEMTDAGIDLTGGISGTLQITLSTAGAQVDGVIRGEDEKPVSGATVALIPDSKRYTLYKSTTTDQSGAFSFKGVTPGDYKLLAWEDIEQGAFQDPEFVKPFESKAQALSLKENERKTALLKVISAEKSAAVR